MVAPASTVARTVLSYVPTATAADVATTLPPTFGTITLPLEMTCEEFSDAASTVTSVSLCSTAAAPTTACTRCT